MSMTKGGMVYEGKAKKIFSIIGHPELVWVEYKDDLTAFNAQKKGSFPGKGKINALITQLIFNELNKQKISTHLISAPTEHELICLKVKIIPLEVVVRNRLAGSTAKKFGIEEGASLEAPLVEFYLKDDHLGDPFVSDDQALMLKAVERRQDLNDLRELALKINVVLKKIFESAGLELIDFKLEFGKSSDGKILLADEISPDTCRLWDLATKEKMDKDRFRRDLGRVEDAYENVLKRLQERLG